jgi:hypothetical protein
MLPLKWNGFLNLKRNGCFCPWCCRTQSFGSLEFAGHEREYFISAPPAGTPPTGLIVALTPGDSTIAMYFCRKTLGEVSAKTGAMVVCPGAMTYNNSGRGTFWSRLSRACLKRELEKKKLTVLFAGHPGGPNPCWLSFAHNGYCMGGKPESSEDVDFLAVRKTQLFLRLFSNALTSKHDLFAKTGSGHT